MDFQRVAKLSPKHHIPEELCQQILSRLPVKSLLRFCCVSKSWLSMIKCPDFCRLHLKNFKNNCDETDLLVAQGTRDHVVRCSSDTFDINRGTHLSTEGGYCMRGAIDGLLLLDSSLGVRIWNPSIRKFHDIAPFPKIEISASDYISDYICKRKDAYKYFDCFHKIKDCKYACDYVYLREVEIGLGYDPMVKDYKYVKLILEIDDYDLALVAVYTLGASSWKIIPVQGKEISSFVWDFDSISSSIYLRGSLYFLATHRETEDVELVSFEMSSEVFYTISMPEDDSLGYPYNYYREGVTLVCIGGGSSLALIQNDVDTLIIWVLDIESMCWTSHGSYRDVPRFLYLKNNREILVNSSDSEINDERVYVISSRNLDTGAVKNLHMYQAGYYNERQWSVYGFKESLVLLQ